LIYTLPKETYETALEADTFHGTADDYFTVAQLAGAKIFEAWSNNLMPYIAYFAGI
jgi:hypothetical protein